MVFTKQWWRAALIRAVKTVAQAAVGLIPAAATILEVDWKTVLGCALLAGLVLAWWGASLFKVAAACCAVVFLTEMVIC